MAKIDELFITGNERVFVNLKNKRTGQPNQVRYIAYGDFGGGTITVDLSPDGGITEVTNINNGESVTFRLLKKREGRNDSRHLYEPFIFDGSTYTFDGNTIAPTGNNNVFIPNHHEYDYNTSGLD